MKNEYTIMLFCKFNKCCSIADACNRKLHVCLEFFYSSQTSASEGTRIFYSIRIKILVSERRIWQAVTIYCVSPDFT